MQKRCKYVNPWFRVLIWIMPGINYSVVIINSYRN